MNNCFDNKKQDIKKEKVLGTPIYFIQYSGLIMLELPPHHPSIATLNKNKAVQNLEKRNQFTLQKSFWQRLKHREI